MLCVWVCEYVHTAYIRQVIPDEMRHIALQIAVHQRARGIHHIVDVMNHFAQIQWIKPKKIQRKR